MELFSIPEGNECIVSDLQWQVLDPFGSKLFGHEQISSLIEDGAKHFVKFKNGSDINFGVCYEFDLDRSAGKKTFSFAAKVATSKSFKGSTALVLVKNTKSDDDLVFAVGVISGNIVIDSMLPGSEANSIYEEFKDLCDRANRAFTVWGDASLDAESPEHPCTLDELLDKKNGTKILLEVLKNDRTMVLVIVGVIIIILLMCLWGAWDWYRSRQKEIIDQVMQTQASPDYLYKQSVATLLSTPALIIPDVWPQYAKQLGEFPVALGGWSLSSISCEGVSCKAHWKSSGGTYDDFKKNMRKDWGPIILSSGEKDVLSDLKTIRHTFVIDVKASVMPAPSTWPKSSEFAESAGVELQKLSTIGWSSTLNPLEQQAIPPGITPSAVRSHPDAIFAFPWSCINQDWEMAKSVMATFKGNTTINSLELQISNDLKITFNGSGYAYVKK